MFQWNLVKLILSIFCGFFFASESLSQRWANEDIPNWYDFSSTPFSGPPCPRWGFGFANNMAQFWGRMINNAIRRDQERIKHTLSNSANDYPSPGLSRLMEEARAAYSLKSDYLPGFKRVVRTGSCGPGCHMKVILSKNNGEYSEKWFQSRSGF